MSKLQPAKPPAANGPKRADFATRFAPGNKAAVGHGGGSGYAAKMRAAMQERVPVEVLQALFDAQVEKAADGDTAAFLAVRDTLGLKPKDVIETHDATIFDLLGIPRGPE